MDADVERGPQRHPLEAAIDHRFADIGLLQRALTHRSSGSRNNERLEFLGDALINLIVGEALFLQLPRAEEGALSRLRSSLVREAALAQLAIGLRLSDHLRLGEGELKSGGWRRSSVQADALEAVIAAVYLDAGFEEVRRVVLRLYAGQLADLPDAESLKDAKTRLQEWLQARGRPLPEYGLISESGPPHRRVFMVYCQLLDAELLTRAGGSSRRGAEQEAARAMLAQLQEHSR